MIIGLIGGKGVGKGTVAEVLMASGGEWNSLSMAAPIRKMLNALGVTNEEMQNERKEEPCVLLGGATPRHAMQTLGDWGRIDMYPDFWLDFWEYYAGSAIDNGINVVCDDVRFPNEAEAVMRQGGFLVKIVGENRRGNAPDAHVSESHHSMLPCHFTIVNDSGIPELQEKVYNVLGEITKWIEDDGRKAPLSHR